MVIFDRAFLRKPKNYLIQSLMATVAVAVILYFVEAFTHAAVAAALGSSAFIVFARPSSPLVKPRRLIGGHFIGLVCGSIAYLVLATHLTGELVVQWEFIRWLVYASSVGLSIFLMAITNTEHPPAAGTALGLVANGWSLPIIGFVIASMISLAIINRLLKPYLVDLL